MIAINKRIYEARADIAKALAHKTRLEIIDILVEKGDKCVCELTELLNVSQSSVSKHLGVLKKASIVDSKKEGLNVTYSLKTHCIKSFFNCIDGILYENLKRRKKEMQLIEVNKND
ncbi:MAG: ArsR/SmtB family transcription factor [Halanaerobiales bacterium]